MQFPDESSYEASQDGTDLIRPGCSVGFNRILGLFKQWAYTDTSARWSMFLLNGATIFRNNFDPKKTFEQIYRDFLSDCEMFTLYYECYLGFTRAPNQRVPIVVYIPDYHTIPNDIAREPSPREMQISKMFAQCAQQMWRRGPTLSSQGQMTDRWIVPVGKSRTPQREVITWMHTALTQSQLASYRWGDSVGIVTHCAVDLHIHKKLPNLSLLESYTGHIKQPKQFGSKLVSDKDVHIPFGVLTHRLFGDPIHIKPAISGRARTLLKELAVKHDWMRKDDVAMFKDARVVKPDLTSGPLLTFNF